MPEDDAPTMTGTPGDRHADVPTDSDDTTTAEAGPPASRGSDDDVADRTVQQKVKAPTARRLPVPPTPARPATLASPSSRPPPTLPSSVPPPGPSIVPTASLVPSTTTSSRAFASAAEIVEEEAIDLENEEIEDSITATAPRVNPAGLTIPRTIKISNVDDDDLADETEVRTLVGHIPISLPSSRRSEPIHSSSQPPPPPRPAAGVPASVQAAPSTQPGGEDEDDDDGVTTEAPAPRVGSVPDLAASIGILPASSGPTTDPQPSAPVTKPSTSGDGPPVATSRRGVESGDELPTRPGVEGLGELPTRPGLGDLRKAERDGGYANDQDEDEEDGNVTARARVVTPEPYEDESVTTQANAVSEQMSAAVRARAPGLPGIGDATLDDGTDGTTQKVKTRKAALSSPADSEAESITTQAPGPLTNILRVLTSEGSTPPIDDDEEPPENRTAVMLNAPLKRIIELSASPPGPSSRSMPAIRPTGPPLTLPLGSAGRGSAAPQLAPSSESGLRVARASAAEHGSLGRLGVGDARPSGTARSGTAMGEGVNGIIDPRAPTEAMFHPSQPSLHDIDLGKGPRYGLLVAIVAFVSFVVPVTLFVVLRGHPDAITPGVPAEPVSELKKHDPPRAKLDKKTAAAASASAAVSASASASSSSHKPPSRPPFRR